VNKPIKEKLEATFKDLEVAVPEESRIVVTAEKHGVLTILRFLKDAGFDHLALLSAVDWIEDNCFELCFILTSYERDDEYTDSQRLHIILKTRIPREKPQFKTVTDIFPNAEPYEREMQVEINIEQMSQEQRDKFAKMAKEGWKL